MVVGTMAESAARESMEKSRIDVAECEEEIKTIKNALRALVGDGGDTSGGSNNRLEVSVMKVVPSYYASGEGGETRTNGDPTTFKIHLSSPIEERILTKVYDPLNPTAEESLAVFTSLETSNALLTIEAYALDGSETSGRKLLGASAPHDLQPLCYDAELWRKGGEKKVTSLDVAIIAGDNAVHQAVEERDSSEEWTDAVSDETKTLDSDDAHIGDVIADGVNVVVKGGTKVILLPLCTLTLQLTYYPSSDEKRDALYDKLNEVSKRKVAAIESLRKSAGIVSRARAAEEEAEGIVVKKGGPAVKSGFLNRSKAGDDSKSLPSSPTFMKRWYDKTVGPKSMLWVIGPIATNYVLFVGVTLFLHYKGDLLALPPPV
jgi:hypothetical protein